MRETARIALQATARASADHAGDDERNPYGSPFVPSRYAADVRTEGPFRALLDCDVVLGTTDDHSSRAILCDLAYAYGVPVIDVGVRAGARAKALNALAAEVRVLTPTTPCLWCREVISADVVREELLPPAQREKLRRERYLVGSTGQPEPSVVPLTVLGAGLATCALLALVSPDGQDAPSGYLVDGFFGDARPVGPTDPVDGCWCRTISWLGDDAPISWMSDATVNVDDSLATSR